MKGSGEWKAGKGPESGKRRVESREGTRKWKAESGKPGRDQKVESGERKAGKGPESGKRRVESHAVVLYAILRLQLAILRLSKDEQHDKPSNSILLNLSWVDSPPLLARLPMAI